MDSTCRRKSSSQYNATDPGEVAAQSMVPLRRYGSVQEVATVVAFLLSDDASYVTGANIEVSYQFCSAARA
jgi:NAD(P)-dependent dehydrogenase (short-subunit alcohol dehydrogenase family)